MTLVYGDVITSRFYEMIYTRKKKSISVNERRNNVASLKDLFCHFHPGWLEFWVYQSTFVLNNICLFVPHISPLKEYEKWGLIFNIQSLRWILELKYSSNICVSFEQSSLILFVLTPRSLKIAMVSSLCWCSFSPYRYINLSCRY
mgnify:CR=1 FL=1